MWLPSQNGEPVRAKGRTRFECRPDVPVEHRPVLLLALYEAGRTRDLQAISEIRADVVELYKEPTS